MIAPPTAQRRLAVAVAVEHSRACPAGLLRNRLLSLDPAIRGAAHAELAAADAERAERALTMAESAANAKRQAAAKARRRAKVARRTSAARNRLSGARRAKSRRSGTLILTKPGAHGARRSTA